MKKNKKILTLILLTFILIGSCLEIFAATLTTESLRKSIEGYVKGEKKAEAEIENTKLSIGGEFENQEVEVTDTTITMSGMTYNYVIKDNKVRFSYDVEVTAGETDFIAKSLYPIGYSTLFVATTDVLGIDSNKALYYYGKINKTITEVEKVPDNVDVNDGLSWFKFLESKGQFKDISNNVFSITNRIEENSDEKFKYTGTLEINLDKLDIITNFEATSYTKTNTNTNVTGEVLKVTNTANQKDLPYSGLEDDNTFIGIALAFIGVSLILYARYAAVKLKEN